MYNDRLQALAQGTVERFVKCGKETLAPDVSKMKGVFYNLKRKYLSNYTDEEMKDDILTEAWVKSVLENEDKIIKAFTGYNFNPARATQKVKAEDWIALVMRNAIINVSISYTKYATECLKSNDAESVGSVSSKVERYDEDYLNALQGYIDDTRNALATLLAGKNIAKRRLESSLKALEKEYNTEKSKLEAKAPLNDFADIYDYFDESESNDDSDYNTRIIKNLLCRLSKEAQVVFVGLYYGMIPYEIKVALELDMKPLIEEIKLAVIDLASEEDWEYENSAILDALKSVDISANGLTYKKVDSQKDLCDKYKGCIADFVDEFGFKAKAVELYDTAFGSAPAPKGI